MSLRPFDFKAALLTADEAKEKRRQASFEREKQAEVERVQQAKQNETNQQFAADAEQDEHEKRHH